MSLDKPYYRIVRPKARIPNYVTDLRYASDRIQLGRSYLSIEKKLVEIFDYIEPDEKNAEVFSLELYSLLLRACTEVELNCKKILMANKYLELEHGKLMTMKDYRLLENSSHLSQYKVALPNWGRRDPNCHDNIVYKKFNICPFEAFGKKGDKVEWYDAYNNVKHNREEYFYEANLKNCINAVAGILVLLYSQFGSKCIDTYGINHGDFGDEDECDDSFDANVIFEIEPPHDWKEEELYNFNWNAICNQEAPFNKFDFDAVKKDSSSKNY